MGKQTIISAIFYFFLFFANSKVKACECSNISFTTDSENADLIFQGVAIDKTDSVQFGKVYYTFRLNEVWKGKHYINIIIKTNEGGPACGASFEIGKEYVVFATNLETTACRRNSDVKNCPDIARLNYKYRLSYKQKIALENSPILSTLEGEYFNNIKSSIHFQNKLADTINFIGKKIAFLDGNIISKQDFFNRYGDKEISLLFEAISNNEILRNDGYDAIIIMHRKIKMTKRQKRKIMEQLL